MNYDLFDWIGQYWPIVIPVGILILWLTYFYRYAPRDLPPQPTDPITVIIPLRDMAGRSEKSVDRMIERSLRKDGVPQYYGSLLVRTSRTTGALIYTWEPDGWKGRA